MLLNRGPSSRGQSGYLSEDLSVWSDMKSVTLEEVKATLAMNLKAIRHDRGVAQERLALDAGVDRTVVSKIERAVTNPSLEVLLKLANQLDVELFKPLD